MSGERDRVYLHDLKGSLWCGSCHRRGHEHHVILNRAVGKGRHLLLLHRESRDREDRPSVGCATRRRRASLGRRQRALCDGCVDGRRRCFEDHGRGRRRSRGRWIDSRAIRRDHRRSHPDGRYRHSSSRSRCGPATAGTPDHRCRNADRGARSRIQATSGMGSDRGAISPPSALT